MKILTAAALATAFAGRYPQAGIVDLEAGDAKGKLANVDAQAVRGFSQVKGKLQWVKATDHFFEAGELVKKDDYVQMSEKDAKRIVAAGRAELATEEEVEAAQAELEAKAAAKASAAKK